MTLSKPKGKNPRISLVLPLLLALHCAPNLVAQTTPDHALLRRVDDHYNHLRTLRAHYTEHYTGMGLDRSESGTLTLKKPGLMRWSYDTPPGKIFVLDGKYAWFYTPDDAQVSRAPANSSTICARRCGCCWAIPNSPKS